MTIAETDRKPPKSEGVSKASLQFRIEPARVPWIYAALQNQPQAVLFQGKFPEPFADLTYMARANQGQLMFAAVLGVSDEFNSRYGQTIGSPEALAVLLKRYPDHEFSPDGKQLVIRKGGQIHGVIARINEKQILVQRGGQAGQLTLSEEGVNPINNLSVQLDSSNLLVQRYVSAIWKASPETNQKNLELVLDIPALPEGTRETYFSTFGIIGREFVERPRPLDLDEDIGGYTNLKATIRSLFMDLTNPNLSRSYGTQPFSNRLVLITGPEGTGKSLFPKALDAMLRKHFKKEGTFEHFRLPLADIVNKYGPYSAMVITTILNHILENEKNGIPTLLHLDNLDKLVLPNQRVNARTNGDVIYKTMPSDAEFQYSLQTITPTVQAIRKFGQDMGGDCHNVIVIGESRLPREDLPEGVSRTFRRSFSLDKPTPADLTKILMVQTNITRKFAQPTGIDPFDPSVDTELDRIVNHASGLNGRDIQQVLIDIATRKKADSPNRSLITAEDICQELDIRRVSSGLSVGGSKGQFGFKTRPN